MPIWTSSEEKLLLDLIKQGKTLETIVKALNRSPDAVAMKVRRMGLPVPPRRTVRETQAEEKFATTTTPVIKPVDELISPQEALQLWLGCINRLNKSDVTTTEVKKIRLMLNALEHYIIVSCDYYLRMRRLEEQMKKMREDMISRLEIEIQRSKDSKDRALLEERLKNLTEPVEVSEARGWQVRRLDKRRLAKVLRELKKTRRRLHYHDHE